MPNTLFRSSIAALCFLYALAVTLFLYQLTPTDLTGLSLFFKACATVAYGLVYFLPVILLSRVLPQHWQKLSLNSPGLWITTLLMVSVQLLLAADIQLYQRYGFHINGFVINILMTPGGIESLGMSGSTSVTVFLIPVAILGGNLALLFVVGNFLPSTSRLVLQPRLYVLVTVLSYVGQGLAYGYLAFFSVQPAFAVARSIPAFQPVTYRTALKKLGYQQPVSRTIDARVSPGKLHYPLAPLSYSKPANPPNIVWLVAESLRADMLTDRIMPNTSQFARKALRFNQHYSGGNGTRMGMFSMFYGLYGSYWFDMLNQRQEPVLFQVLKSYDYQMEFFTSSKFTYPEFDKTIFAGFPGSKLQEDNDGAGWERDQRNVSRMLDFIVHRDTNHPFMTFLFFESPHARYYFPDNAIIEPDYLKDFNYLSTDIAGNIQKIKNRYINSVHHLDKQLQRIFAGLKDNGLLDNTIVIVTGDHGEEFMEKGYWGHNSSFVQEQIRVPLILYIPGQDPAAIDKTTNHIDIVPTLLPLLGVSSPVEDYALGINLLSEQQHDFMVLADWDSVNIVTSEFKQNIPLRAQGMAGSMSPTTLNDEPLETLQRDQQYRQILLSAFDRTNHFYQ